MLATGGLEQGGGVRARIVDTGKLQALTGQDRPVRRARGDHKGKVVGASLNTVAILCYLSSRTQPVTLTQISRDLDLNSSSCLSILHTLSRVDFVSIDEDLKRYSLGLGVLQLASSSSALRRDVGAVRPLFERVATRHDVTVALWRQVSRDHRILILVATAPGKTRIHLGLGQRPPLLSGSGGRVIAAFSDMSEAELRAQFKKVRWDRPVPFRKYMEEVRETRKRGWSVDIGTNLEGVAAVGVPIFDAQGDLLMVCTALMFANQYSDQFGRELAEDLLALSRNITLLAPAL